jgi:hypothetical protein
MRDDVRLYRTTVHLLVAVPAKDEPEQIAQARVFDEVSGVLSDGGEYVDPSIEGGPIGIVDWGYAHMGNELIPVDPAEVLDLAGFVHEGNFLALYGEAQS